MQTLAQSKFIAEWWTWPPFVPIIGSVVAPPADNVIAAITMTQGLSLKSENLGSRQWSIRPVPTGWPKKMPVFTTIPTYHVHDMILPMGVSRLMAFLKSPTLSSVMQATKLLPPWLVHPAILDQYAHTLALLWEAALLSPMDFSADPFTVSVALAQHGIVWGFSDAGSVLVWLKQMATLYSRILSHALGEWAMEDIDPMPAANPNSS